MLRAPSALLVAAWLLLIAIFVDISPTQPLWPSRQQSFDGAEFSALAGGQIEGTQLAVASPDDNDGALLIRSVDIVDAAAWPVLRYRFESLAPTLELTLVYRRADSPEDVRTVSLTRPRGTTGTIDLSREKDWHGAITEIGFAVYPVAQSVPPEHAFQPFRLRAAEFWSPSWRGRIGAVSTEWSGRRAWSLMSISALGPDNGAMRAHSPVLLLTLGLAVTWLLLRRRRAGSVSTLRIVAIAVAIAWLLLDLRWLRSFNDRHAATRQVYAGLPWSERQQRLSDSDVLAAAAAVRAALREDGVEPDRVRLLVDAASDFLRARFIYHLAPARSAPVNFAGYGSAYTAHGAVYLATFDQPLPRFDAAASSLELDGDSLRARALIDAPPLRLFRIEYGGAP